MCIRDSWIVAFPLGFYSATHKYSIADHTFTAVSFFGVSVPEFLLAIGIMYLYFQSTGQYAGGLFSDQFANEPWSLAKFHDMLQHVWIPLLVIVVTGTAGLFKTFRANLLDELSKPYVKTAQAKGVPYLRLLVKYPVRIALIPFISTVAVSYTHLDVYKRQGMDKLVEIRDLVVRFRTDEGVVSAVNGVSYDINIGETLGIVGESGCGKSVSSNALMCILPENGWIESGSILYHSEEGTFDVAKLPARDRRIELLHGKEIAMIFQEPMTSFCPVYTLSLIHI